MALATALVAAAPSGAAPTRLDEPGRSASDALQGSPRVAVGSDGPVVLFSDARDVRGTTRVAHRDGGAWRDALLLEHPSPPAALASDGTGTVWAFEQEGARLRARSTTGNGVWELGPAIDDVPYWGPSAVAGGAGLIALAWGPPGPCIAATGSGRGSGVYPVPGPARVVVLDTRNGTVFGAVDVGSDDARAFALAIDAEGRVLLAGAGDQGIELSTMDPSGTWSTSPAVVAERATDLTLAALADGEIVLAWTTPEHALRWSTRSPLTGAWSAPRQIADEASAPRLVAHDADTASIPLPTEGGAWLYWLSGSSLRRAGYTSMVAGVLSDWTAEAEVAQNVSEYDVAPAHLAFAAFDGARADVFASDAGGGSPERVHDDTPAAASKLVTLVAPSGGSFEALWFDDRGRTSPSLHRGRIPSAGAPTDTGLTSESIAALASDGSLLDLRRTEDGIIATVHDETRGTRRSILLPVGDAHGVTMGPATFAVASTVWGQGVVSRVYSDGAWSAPQRTRLPRWGSFVLQGSGAGTAWLAWTLQDRSVAGGDATTPEPVTPQRYHVFAAPLSAGGQGSVRTIGSGRSMWAPALASAGDEAGGLALLWDEHDRDRVRAVFATNAGGATRVTPPSDAWGARIAASAGGDGVIVWSAHDRVATARRSAGGAFTRLPDLDVDTTLPEGGAAIPCVLATVIALPEPPQPLMHADGTTHLVYSSADEKRYVTLAPGGASWSPPVVLGTGSVFEPAYAAIARTGAVAAAWVSGEYPDRRVVGAVLWPAAD